MKKLLFYTPNANCKPRRYYIENRKLDFVKKLSQSDECIIFKTNYKQNFKSGFWEVEYLVNKSIVVPSEMLVK